MRRLFLTVLTAALAASPQSPAPNSASWKLVWSDEFNGAANTRPDASKWVYDIGHDVDGWGNHELETYTKSLENVHQDGQGHLVIRALKDESGNYTSGRLITKGKFTTTYGKIEARIKLAYGQGIWPAFWAMGADIDKLGWPHCGEIDIMENIGKEPGVFHVFLGYAGWGPGQLEHEVELGAWHILPPDTASVFDADPESVWPRLIRRTELRIARERHRSLTLAAR